MKDKVFSIILLGGLIRASLKTIWLFEQFRIRWNASQTEFVSRDEGAIIPITGFPNIQTEIENFTIEVACLAPVSRSNWIQNELNP